VKAQGGGKMDIPNSRSLTLQQVRQLRSLREDNTRLKDISNQTGVPWQTVYKYVKDIKLTKSLRSKISNDKVMREMLEEGYTHSVIALKFKVCRSAVTKRLSRRRGRKRGKGREMTSDQVFKAKAMKENGLSYDEIAKLLGFTKPAIYRRLKKEELTDD
jgi:predicted transcriptional regulator